MMQQALTKSEQLKSGDIIRIVFYEQNCGIDETVFTAIVVELKECFIAIPQDFQGHIFYAAKKGAVWKIEIDWLLENDTEAYLIERFDDLVSKLWKVVPPIVMIMSEIF